MHVRSREFGYVYAAMHMNMHRPGVVTGPRADAWCRCLIRGDVGGLGRQIGEAKSSVA